jgi:hypothetical protein
MTEDKNTLFVPVKNGFKSDNTYHRRNWRSLETYMQSPYLSTANIQDLAVTDGKIGSLSVDKLTAGDLSAAVIVTGLLSIPATTGYRVELGNASYPMRYWDGTTTNFSVDNAGNVSLTGSIDATGGSITGDLSVSGTISAPADLGTNWHVEIGDTTYPLRYWNSTDTAFAVDNSGNITMSGNIVDSSGTIILRPTGYSRCKVRNGAGDTISTSSNTTMTIVTEDADTDSYWNGSDDYVIVPFTGQYQILCQASFGNNSDGTTRKVWVQNAVSPYSSWANIPGGAFEDNRRANADDRTTCMIGDVVDLTALDGVRVRVWQNSGSNMNVGMKLAIVYLGPS